MAGNNNSGRRPKPDAIHRITGNPSKKTLSSVSDLRSGTIDWSPLNTLPECPEHLDAVARERWNALAPDLHALGLLTRVDGDELAIYCEAYSEWVEASTQLKLKGQLVMTPNGFAQINQWRVVQKQAIEKMRTAQAAFGLNPSARSKQLQPVVEVHQMSLFEEEESKKAMRVLNAFDLH